jgi:uncharacterized damage-inducible protein DinB
MFTGTQPHLMALYNRWMNRRLYAACATLTDAQRREDMGLFFKSIEATLEHLIWGDTAWMTRFEGLPVGAPPAGGPPQRPFEELTAAREALDERMLTWAASLTPEWMNEPMTWTSKLYGFTQTQPRWVQLTQVFNHQTHHRGQVHAALTRLGVDMGPTDVPLLPELLA